MGRGYSKAAPAEEGRWRFHECCGQNVEVMKGGGCVVKLQDNITSSMVFSAEPLPPGQAFTVRVDTFQEEAQGQVTIGLTTDDPVSVSQGSTKELQNSWMICSDGNLHRDGALAGRSQRLQSLQISRGDVIGVSWKPHVARFHINGLIKFKWEVDQGDISPPASPLDRAPTPPVWAVFDMKDFQKLQAVDMFPKGCELNEMAAASAWISVVKLLDENPDIEINRRDCYDKSPLDWTWLIPLTHANKFVVLERLLDSGLPINFAEETWKSMIQKSLLYNSSYRVRMKYPHMQEKLIYLAYKVSAIGYINTNLSMSDISLFSKLCMCRAGVNDLIFLQNVVSLTGTCPCAIPLEIVASVADMSNIKLLFNFSSEMGDLAALWPAVWTLKSACVKQIRLILTSDEHGKSLVRGAEKLQKILPGRLLSLLTLDHLFGDAWAMKHFDSTFDTFSAITF